MLDGGNVKVVDSVCGYYREIKDNESMIKGYESAIKKRNTPMS